MNRDDFSYKTKSMLAKRVGYLCSNPLCGCATVGPQRNGGGIISIGVAAHICAAAPNGPRYDAIMTPMERRSINNGIWLCQSCARLIDVESDRYTVSLLKKWKEVAEQKQMLRMRVAGANSGTERMIYIFTCNHKKLFEKYSLKEIQGKILENSYLFNVKRISLERNSIQVICGFETELEKECYLDKLFSIFAKLNLIDIVINEKPYC